MQASKTDRINLLKGIGLALLVDLISFILFSAIGLQWFKPDSPSSSDHLLLFVPLILLALIGFWQILVILPFILYLKIRQRSELIQGVLLGSGLILLFNTLVCAGQIPF